MPSLRIPDSSYNPLTDIPWYYAFWASDPLWNLGVPTRWRNGGTPVFSRTVDISGTSLSSINGQTAVLFPVSQGSSGVAGFTLTSWTLISIGQITTHDENNGDIIAAIGPSSSGYWGRSGGIGYWNVSQGTSSSQTTYIGDLLPHLFRVTPGALAVDEVTVAGCSSMNATNLAINRTPGGANLNAGMHAFIGLYAGDITRHVEWPTFKRWAQSYYGLKWTG